VNSSAPPGEHRELVIDADAVTDATDQPGAKSTGIASAHGSAGARRPLSSEDEPCCAEPRR
jgi:hypothetical protein